MRTRGMRTRGMRTRARSRARGKRAAVRAAARHGARDQLRASTIISHPDAVSMEGPHGQGTDRNPDRGTADRRCADTDGRAGRAAPAGRALMITKATPAARPDWMESGLEADMLHSDAAKRALQRGLLEAKRQQLRRASLLARLGRPLLISIVFVSFVHILETIASIRP